MKEIQSITLTRKIPGCKEDVNGIPIIRKQNIDLEKIKVIQYRKKLEEKLDCKIIAHFFMDDKFFNGLFNDPTNPIKYMYNYDAIMTPDYSMYLDTKKKMVELNTYMNRWLGSFWQWLGFNVIPTIGWTDPNMYDICFSGVEEGCIVAINSYGSAENKEVFLNGFVEMKKRIKPSKIICVGRKIKEIQNDDSIVWVDYKTTFIYSKNKKQGPVQMSILDL